MGMVGMRIGRMMVVMIMRVVPMAVGAIPMAVALVPMFVRLVAVQRGERQARYAESSSDIDVGPPV